jgi:hypothetical protein
MPSDAMMCYWQLRFNVLCVPLVWVLWAVTTATAGWLPGCRFTMARP